MPDDSWGWYITPVSTAKQLHYFNFDRENAKVYSTSTSASVGAKAKSVTVLFEGEAGSYVKGLCFVERVGAVLLLSVPLSANSRSDEKKKYQLQLRAVNSQNVTSEQSFVLALAPLVDDEIEDVLDTCRKRRRESSSSRRARRNACRSVRASFRKEEHERHSFSFRLVEAFNTGWSFGWFGWLGRRL